MSEYITSELSYEPTCESNTASFSDDPVPLWSHGRTKFQEGLFSF